MTEGAERPEKAGIEQGAEQIDAAKMVKLIFWSFGFSQGDPNLQGKIYGYLKSIRPNWRIPADEMGAFKERVRSKLEPAIANILNKGAQHAQLDTVALGPLFQAGMTHVNELTTLLKQRRCGG